MKMLVLTLLLVFGAVSGALARAAPFDRKAPPVDARALLHSLQVARGYGTCVLKCEDRYQACINAATTDDARRTCRLDRNLCESDCSRFGTR